MIARMLAMFGWSPHRPASPAAIAPTPAPAPLVAPVVLVKPTLIEAPVVVIIPTAIATPTVAAAPVPVLEYSSVLTYRLSPGGRDGPVALLLLRPAGRRDRSPDARLSHPDADGPSPGRRDRLTPQGPRGRGYILRARAGPSGADPFERLDDFPPTF